MKGWLKFFGWLLIVGGIIIALFTFNKDGFLFAISAFFAGLIEGIILLGLASIMERLDGIEDYTKHSVMTTSTQNKPHPSKHFLSENEKELVNAVLDEDIKKVEALLNSGADPFTRSEAGTKLTELTDRVRINEMIEKAQHEHKKE